MSATPRNGGTLFTLTSEDVEGSAELRRRTSARKLARLTPAKNLSQSVVREALDLAKDDRVNVVGVVVNSVADARDAFNSLRVRSDAVLLTGRVRPHDRDQILKQWLPRMQTGRDYSNDKPLFVVATQTIEVGADLDFDALVTEAAPIDVLRQRFGRLDRLGRLGESRGAVVRKPNKDSPIYGEATAKTWAWLSEQRAIDFGPVAMAEVLGSAPTPGLLTPVARAPQLLPAHLNAWTMTRPAPQVDPAVGPYLHGPDALDSIEVFVAWRADLAPDSPNLWPQTVALAPPQAHELMPVPIGAALAWLSERPALIWRGDENPVIGRVQPGETLLVPAEYGGADAFGWAPDSEELVEDVADKSGRWRRFHPKLLKEDQKRTLLELLQAENIEPKDFDAIEPLSGKPLSWQPYPDRSGAVVYLRPPLWEDDPASLASRAVLLSSHLASVASVAREFAADIPEAEQIQVAARLHDLGKLDPRFQTMLHGGREAAAATALFSGAALAKSAQASNLTEYHQILRASGYPAKARHEAGSTLLAASLVTGDLILHLIAAHHGWARPGFLPWTDDVRLEVRFEERDLAVQPGAELAAADSPVGTRFWSLNQKLGPWRLAFLEAVLRLADQRCSREEAKLL
jgi:CRISPR-associated endonuclease/helicase Cas3